MKRSHIFKLITASALCLIVFAFAQQAFATTLGEYIPLAPLPGITTEMANNLPSFLIGVFRFAIGLAGLLAVIMITIGGFQYMTSEAIGQKSAGKERISQAFTGLLLAIASWLILYTINPKTIEFNLNPTPVGNIAAPTSNTTGAFHKYRYCFFGTATASSTDRQDLGTFPFEADTVSQARTACYNSQPAPVMGIDATTPPCPEGSVSMAIVCQRVEN
jgi:hypothetical protein